MLSGEKLLKRGLHRSVWLSACGGTVIKRFRSAGFWRRATDGRRARREARMLARLAELELPVPRLIALERSSAGWEVHSAVIAESRSLEELLEGDSDPAGGVDPARLGTSLARFHARGFLHGDLHPGNLLATDRQAWFVIDVSRGRIRTPLPRADALHELGGLFAAIRERTTDEWRAAFLRAWSEAATPSLGPPAADERARLERAARCARQRSVLAHLDRWVRPSSRLRAFETEGELWLVDRRIADSTDSIRSLSRVLPGTPSKTAPESVTTIDGSEAKRRWLAAARALEHRLPHVRPIAWNAARSLAVLEAVAPGPPRELRASDPESRGLAEALSDRGLFTDAPPLVERTAEGHLVLSPAHEFPTSFRTVPEGAAWDAWFADSRAPGHTA